MQAIARIGSPGLLGAGALMGLAALVGLIAAVNPALAIPASLGVLFGLVVIANLGAGFALFTFVAFIEILPAADTPFLSVSKAVGLLLALSWLAVVTTRPGMGATEMLAAHRGFTFMIMCFLAWTALSALWAQEPGESGLAFSRFALNLLLFPIAYTAIRDPHHVKWFFIAFVGGALLSTAVGAFGVIETVDEGRLRGTGLNPNDLATFLVAGLALSGGLAATATRSPPLRAAAVVAVVLCAAGIVFTLSRAGLIALGVVLVASLLVASRRRVAVGVVALILTMGTVAYFGVIAPPEARERVTTLQSGSGRIDLWTVAWRMVEDRPLIGVGAGNFAASANDYLLEAGRLPFAGEIVTRFKVVHNVYLESAAELGLIGVAIFIVLVAFPVACSLRAARNFAASGDRSMEVFSRALFVAQAGALVAAVFASIQFQKQLWLLLAVGPAVLAISSRIAPERED